MSLGGNVRGIELVERTPRKQLAGECHPRWWLFCLGFAVGSFWGLWCILFCGVVFFFKKNYFCPAFYFLVTIQLIDPLLAEARARSF